jgi:hypothetical protein
LRTPDHTLLKNDFGLLWDNLFIGGEKTTKPGMEPNARTISLRARRVLPLIATALVAISCGSLQSVTTDEGIEIREGDTRILFYQMKPKSLNGKYERAHYVHPLFTLKGNVLTEDFPEDHPHHHGIFSAWHQVWVNGTRVADSWTSENLSWDVSAARADKGEGTITISSEVLWKSALEPSAQSQPIVKETASIVVHRSAGQYRAIDFAITLAPLADSVMIGGSQDNKGYGGFSLRLKLPDNIRFVARDGEVQAQVEAIDAGPWMNFRGSFDGAQSPESGVVVFSHPSNRGNPQPWILRSEKSMQNAAYPGRHPVPLEKRGLTLRYRVIIHDGTLDRQAVEALFGQFARVL